MKVKHCPDCQQPHAAQDAVIVGSRFSGVRGYRARHGMTVRTSRAQAVADECAWRQTRPTRCDSRCDSPVRQPATPPDAGPFPAAAMEILAREQAWRDFLAHAAFSLHVEQIDPDLPIEPAAAWLARCAADLTNLTKAGDDHDHRRTRSPLMGCPDCGAPTANPLTRPCLHCTHPTLPTLCRHCGCRMTHHPDQQQGAHLMCSIRAARQMT